MNYRIFDNIEEIDAGFKYVGFFTETLEDGGLQTYFITEKEAGVFEKKLRIFIEKYKIPAIINPMKTTKTYKIIKGFSEADLLRKLKNVESDLDNKWRIISDLHYETVKGIPVWYVEIARIDFDFLENL